MSSRKKKNKALPLLILVVILIALIGAYVLLQGMQKDEGAEDEADTVTIQLADFAKDSIASITYGGEEKITILNASGVWYLEGDEKFPLNQTLASKMAESIVGLSASKAVESEDLTEFGLDTPELEVNVKLTNGEEYIYSIGDVNSFNSMTYILTAGRVYMFTDSFSTNFAYDKDELMVISDAFPTDITDESIKSVTLRDADGAEKSYDSTEATLSDIKKCFSFTDVNAYGLSEDEMASLGFNENGAAVVIKYSTATDTSTDAATLEATFTILLGEADGVRVYALKDGDMTYTVDSDLFDSIFEASDTTAD